MIRRKLFSTVIGCALIVSVEAVGATKLLEQPPINSTRDGLQADSSTGSFSQVVSSARPGTLDSIAWWGFHGPNSFGPSEDNFEVYLDGVLQTGVLSTEEVVLGDLSVITRYVLDIPDAPMNASSVEIVNNSLDVEWFWQYSSFDGPNADDLSFAFIGTPVPEPSTVAMFLLGLAGLGVVQRTSRRV